MKYNLSPFRVIMIFTCLAIIGICMLPLLNLQLTGNRSPTSLQVDYNWPNASAKAIEQEVTLKMEGPFNSIKDIQEIRSESKKGSGRISIDFNEGTNLDASRFEVASIIRQVYSKLPVGVDYPQISTSAGIEGNPPILAFSINSTKSAYFIQRHVERYITPKISLVEGVGRVDLYGASPYQWNIKYDPKKLQQLNVAVNDIFEGVNNYLDKKELGVGVVQFMEPGATYEIPISFKYRPPEEIDWNSIPVNSSGQKIVYLKDVARIDYKEKEKKAYYRVNGLSTINMAIYPEKGANNLLLDNTIKEKVRQLQDDYAQHYNIELTKDSTAFLKDELYKIELRTLFSLLILLILVAGVYRSIKYFLIIVFVLIADLLLAVILYYSLDVQLQLYSFAGITISFGIMIDNSIIMIDHIIRKGNKKVFLAIFAGTLTTIASVLTIFLLEESQRLNLWDFALVITINLTTSLFVSYYLVPSLISKLNLSTTSRPISTNNSFNGFTSRYRRILMLLNKFVPKWALILCLVLSFGIPLHMAPNQVSGEGFWSETYNRTMGNEWFINELKPALEKYLGGTLRLFTENVFENSYTLTPARTSLRITGKMPEGCTIGQLNTAIKKMESYISAFEEVDFFETTINSYRSAVINVYFEEEHEFGIFPLTLKGYLESKAISLGGVDWTVSGIGRGFSNAMMSEFKNGSISLEGYNFEKLLDYAQMLQTKIVKVSSGRVEDCVISSGIDSDSPTYEYYLELKPERLSFIHISPFELYNSIKNQISSVRLNPIINRDGLQDVVLLRDPDINFEMWELLNTPIIIDNNTMKLKDLAVVTKRRAANTIRKVNQSYRLTVEYDYLGPPTLAKKFQKEQIEQFAGILPIGYRVLEKQEAGWWDKENSEQYYYLLLIVVIIFFISSILLESIKQAFIIILMIPISFIGVFLVFYFFELNFDQGGYASFILLSGISVNSAIYIINDYNIRLREDTKIGEWEHYSCAFNDKITPILVTIISTIAGLIPFLWDGKNEVFWFAFAAGSIGGLIFSLLGLFIYLPLLLPKKVM